MMRKVIIGIVITIILFSITGCNNRQTEGDLTTES